MHLACASHSALLPVPTCSHCQARAFRCRFGVAMVVRTFHAQRWALGVALLHIASFAASIVVIIQVAAWWTSACPGVPRGVKAVARRMPCRGTPAVVVLVATAISIALAPVVVYVLAVAHFALFGDAFSQLGVAVGALAAAPTLVAPAVWLVAWPLLEATEAVRRDGREKRE